MYTLILTIILWRTDNLLADAAPTVTAIPFKNQTVCEAAAIKWKQSLVATMPRNTGAHYTLSAECVATDTK